jgi:hypothetical protein
VRLAVAVAPELAGNPRRWGRRNALAPGGIMAFRGLSGAVPVQARRGCARLGLTPLFAPNRVGLSGVGPGAQSRHRVVAAYVEESPEDGAARLAARAPSGTGKRIGAGFPASAVRRGRGRRLGCPASR